MEILLAILGALTLLCLVALYAEFVGRLNRLDARVRRLEEAKQKRINYESLEEIDALEQENARLREALRSLREPLKQRAVEENSMEAG